MYNSPVISRLKNLFGSVKAKPSAALDGLPSREVFDLEAQYAVLSLKSLKDSLGDEAFGELRTIARKISSPGEIILSESRGLRLETIASNLKDYVAKLDGEITSKLQAGGDALLNLWVIMDRFDDLADIGSRHDQDTKSHSAVVTNLLKFGLSLLKELQKRVEPSVTDLLVKRFAAKEALRGERLWPYVALPGMPFASEDVSKQG